MKKWSAYNSWMSNKKTCRSWTSKKKAAWMACSFSMNMLLANTKLMESRSEIHLRELENA
jgi:hypothetical protein